MNNNLNCSSDNIIIKKSLTGRIIKIKIKNNENNNNNNKINEKKERKIISPSRHDTSRTQTNLKIYPKLLSPNKKFKIGNNLNIQRRCDSPLKSRIIEIYKNFTPSVKNYKSIHPKWKR